MYNQGNINLTYENGNISVEFKNLSGNNITKFKIYHRNEITSDHNCQEKHENSTDKYTGEVKPSCEGHITFADNKKESFQFSEENKEIIWTCPDVRDKWIRG